MYHNPWEPSGLSRLRPLVGRSLSSRRPRIAAVRSLSPQAQARSVPTPQAFQLLPLPEGFQAGCASLSTRPRRAATKGARNLIRCQPVLVPHSRHRNPLAPPNKAWNTAVIPVSPSRCRAAFSNRSDPVPAHAQQARPRSSRADTELQCARARWAALASASCPLRRGKNVLGQVRSRSIALGELGARARECRQRLVRISRSLRVRCQTASARWRISDRVLRVRTGHRYARPHASRSGLPHQAVDPRHCHYVAWLEGFQHAQQFAPIGPRTAHLPAEDPRALFVSIASPPHGRRLLRVLGPWRGTLFSSSRRLKL